jgi:GNAT superfamily N-acetyltransferase
MQIIDLTPEHEQLYFHCLADWSEEMKEAGDHKERWYREAREQGLRVKLALDDRGDIGGMIQYLPAEHGFVEGRDLNVILCIWVHGHPQGRGNFQRKGMGKALLAAAEQDTRAQGKKGLVAWGVSLPVFMKASWFKRRGYRPVDRTGIQVLLWKPFSPDAQPPRWVRQKKKPAPTPGKITVSAFLNGWCPAQNITFERARRAAAELGEKVLFQANHTQDPAVFAEWGISDGLYIDGRSVRTGPPPSFETIRRLIARKVRSLRA